MVFLIFDVDFIGEIKEIFGNIFSRVKALRIGLSEGFSSLSAFSFGFVML